tara:strand:- start:50376 stop:50807 length:432 start_codon:yes stop_codon:yes gene_type:complete
MKNFLKNILRKSTVIVSDGGTGGNGEVKFKVSNPTVTSNACESVFQGIIIIPDGYTGDAFGEMIAGNAGGNNPAPNGVSMFIGSKNFSAGTTPYTVKLANSEVQNLESEYQLTVGIVGESNTRTISFKRTQAHSNFYDNPPCI